VITDCRAFKKELERHKAQIVASTSYLQKGFEDLISAIEFVESDYYDLK